MKKKIAVGLLAACIAMASVIRCGTQAAAAQEDAAPQNETAEVQTTDDGWEDSRRKVIAGCHWLTKPEVGVQAERVPLVFVEASDGAYYSRPLDGNHSTYNTMKQDTTLRFASESPFERLYIKTEHSCRWTVTLPDGTVKQGGENGFIHELMELEQSVTSFDLHMPEGSALCDIYAFTAGALPDWVQIWEPPCENADFLVLPTHADDEHLWFGGVMPYYAGELAYKVQVVYMTNHFNQNERSHELLNGLWTVGVRHYPIISERFNDIYATKASVSAAERIFGRENVVEFQVEILRRFSPKVVIAHDIHGEYGHGVHVLNAQTVLEALPLTDDPTAFPESAEKYGTCKVQKCYLHLWQERPIVMEWRDMPLARFDGVSALEMAVKGFHCHVSQLRWSFHVADSGRLDCRQFGLAYTTVGDDTPDENDMLEHVVWSESTLRRADSGVTSPEKTSVNTPNAAPSGNSADHDPASGNAVISSGQTAEAANRTDTAENAAAAFGSDAVKNGFDDFDGRTLRLLAFLSLAMAGIICACVVTLCYSKKL